ncbi:hypothetical protein BDZ91DRAFT_763549 [Kalaharituber pfeilii]|nr:hypothetical protein BDZ91DRAFT_763549 [Kalaharituber pfeilii]
MSTLIYKSCKWAGRRTDIRGAKTNVVSPDTERSNAGLSHAIAKYEKKVVYIIKKELIVVVTSVGGLGGGLYSHLGYWQRFNGYGSRTMAAAAAQRLEVMAMAAAEEYEKPDGSIDQQNNGQREEELSTEAGLGPLYAGELT